MNNNLILISTLCIIFALGLSFLVIYYFSYPKNLNYGSNAGDGLIVSNVNIDSIDLLHSSVQPGLYILVIKGMLPDSCSQIEDTVISIKPNQIDVSLNAKKPSDSVCSTEEREFEISKELDFSNLPEGEYLIKVAEFEKKIEYNKASFDN